MKNAPAFAGAFKGEQLQFLAGFLKLTVTLNVEHIPILIMFEDSVDAGVEYEAHTGNGVFLAADVSDG